MENTALTTRLTLIMIWNTERPIHDISFDEEEGGSKKKVVGNRIACRNTRTFLT